MTVIRRGMLSDLFIGAAVKQLSAVETDASVSNQHEFNGAGVLRRVFGDGDRKDIPTRFLWLGDEQEGVSVEGVISWYDARRRHPVRSEYRLYYSSNTVTSMMQAGDSFFLALRSSGDAMVIVTPYSGTIRSQLLWLFGLDEQQGFAFTATEIGESSGELDFAARYILDELGLDIQEGDTDELDELLKPFGMEFPKTRPFAELARRSLPDIDSRDNADTVLMAWLEREELLFRRLERGIVAGRLKTGFVSDNDEADVEGFLSFSLSVQNRRKSRAGQSLEHHLEELFRVRDLKFQRGAETENRNKPDFLFPGQMEYRDMEFPVSRLTMLGSKSTAKDRWRQVLSEAERISQKHLVTLEPGISEGQTSEMQAKRLQLVVPASLHRTYKPDQQAWLFDVRDFVRLVEERQTQSG